MPSEPECRTCREPMSEITLLDRIHTSGAHTTYLEYTVPVARRSFWSGRYPVEGEIDAFLCERCGEVRLFGRSTT